MADFSALKAAIQTAIKTNGNEEITGSVLQNILLSIVTTMGDSAINGLTSALNSETTNRQNEDVALQTLIGTINTKLAEGYVYAGIATSSTNPGTPTGKVFYIAKTAGTYTNFGGLAVTQGINILKFNGTAWSQEQVLGIDDEPTADSPNLVKSGGIQKELALGAVYDVSAKNPTAGTNNDGKWESLSALLSDANLNTLIPTAYRKGGMSIKFVHTSDNNYVQYFLKEQSFTTNEEDWEKMNLEDEVNELNSKINDVGKWEQRDVTQEATTLSGKYIDIHGTVKSVNNWECLELSVVPGEVFTISAVAGLAFRLWEILDGNGNVLGLSSDSSAVSYKTESITIPPTATKLYVNARQASASDNPPTIIRKQYSIYAESVFVGDETIKEYVDDVKDYTDDRTDYVRNGLVDKKDDAEIQVGKYIDIHGNVKTVANWEYLELSVNPGEKYQISATAGLTIRLWIIEDSNGNVLDLSTDSSAVSYKTESITIPLQAAKLYVNARQASISDPTPKIFLKKHVVDANLVYFGETSVKEYIDNTIAGNPQNLFHYDSSVDKVSYIISPFNSLYRLMNQFLIRRSSSQSNNPDFNFVSISLISQELQETVIHSVGDDITPANYNGSYLGGNHGDSDVRQIKCTNHGKTYADIGSIWNNGTNDYTIVAIVDVDNLLVLGENLMEYPLFSFAKDIAAEDTLTHVSGATHTDSIVVETSTNTQFYSSLSVKDVKIIADGSDIVDSGDYYFKHLDICEMYDVLNVASVLNLIQQGVGTFIENPNPNSFTSADKVARHSIVYGFDSAGEWRIRTDFIAYQDINLNYFGFTQQGVLPGTGVKMYIPKALQVDGKDFRTIQDYSSLSNSINLTPEYWENPNLPPDRWIQYNDHICIHSGFLFDYGIGGVKRKDNINNAFYLYKNTRKTYPHGIDSNITVSAGDVFSAVVWRSYMDLSGINSNGVIAIKMFEYDEKLYIYGDFNESGIYEMTIPDKYVGRMISVFEKSNNVTLLAEVANAKVLVKVESASPMYGYIVAQIK